jgi:hypothetical protein
LVRRRRHRCGNDDGIIGILKLMEWKSKVMKYMRRENGYK